MHVACGIAILSMHNLQFETNRNTIQFCLEFKTWAGARALVHTNQTEPKQFIAETAHDPNWTDRSDVAAGAFKAQLILAIAVYISEKGTKSKKWLKPKTLRKDFIQSRKLKLLKPKLKTYTNTQKLRKKKRKKWKNIHKTKTNENLKMSKNSAQFWMIRNGKKEEEEEDGKRKQRET